MVVYQGNSNQNIFNINFKDFFKSYLSLQIKRPSHLKEKNHKVKKLHNSCILYLKYTEKRFKIPSTK